MSAEAVTVKKRGRPAKKAVSPTTDSSNNVIVEVDAVPTSPLPPQQKTRGKSVAGGDVAAVTTAKKSSSTTESKKVKSETGRSAAVSTSKPAAAASTTTTTRKRAVKTPTATSAAAVEEKLPSSSSRTKTLKAESVEVPEDPPVVAEKAASPAKVAATASTEKPAAQVKKQVRSTKAQESQSASSLPGQQTKAEPVSEILQQARAFTKTSSSDEAKKGTSTRLQVLDRKAEQPKSSSEPVEPTISANQVLDSILAEAEAKQPSTADMDSTLEAPKQGTKSTATTPSSSSSPPPSSLPSKLLTTNPLFTATRPKYTLPYSTTAALASRHQQQEEQKQKQQSAQRAVRRTGAGGGFRSSRPPPTDPAARGDPSKAPAMSHDEIRKTPQYRKTNARVRRVIVALPIAIVSSYYLYQRRDEQRVYEERLLALGRGGAGAAAGSSGKGVTGNPEGGGAAAGNGRAE